MAVRKQLRHKRWTLRPVIGRAASYIPFDLKLPIRTAHGTSTSGPADRHRFLFGPFEGRTAVLGLALL